MTTITDFTNELHIRLYVAELLKDYVKDESFNDMAERVFSFIVKGSNLQLQPVKDNTMQELMCNLITTLNGGCKINDIKEKSHLEKLYDKYKNKTAIDPVNNARKGIIVGYSNEFNSLIVSSSHPSPKGVDKGEYDFVDNTIGYIHNNGYFYITEEEIKKQYED